MSYNFGATAVSTPAGTRVLTKMVYGATEKSGVSVLIAASAISLLAVLGLLVVLGVSTYKTIRTPTVHRFMRTHFAAYFVSLLLCDVISTIGSLMNGQWTSDGGVSLGAFCTTQGALKNTGNVGTALWSLVIAVHTFSLLVMKWKSKEYVLYATLFVVWSFIGLVVIIGPSAVQNMAEKGPYFGVSGYWCWITDGYSVERVALEYFWMFLSAFVSFVLYSVVFLSLRGNIINTGGRLSFYFKLSPKTWHARTGSDSPDGQAMSLARHMLMYPIAYTALILPIAICRFMEWAGHDIPFQATIFADTVFMLSGLVNVILFTSTRNIVPTRGALSLFSRSKSTTSDLESQKASVPHVTPFVMAEKVTISPLSPETQIASIPVDIPVPAMQAPRVGKKPLPKRNASYSANIDNSKSRQKAQDTQKSYKKSIRQSIITPLRVVKKSSLRKKDASPTVPEPALLPRALASPPDEREEYLGQRESWGGGSSSRYSASSYSSTTPLQDLSAVALTPPHSSAKPSTSSRYGTRGTRF